MFLQVQGICVCLAGKVENFHFSKFGYRNRALNTHYRHTQTSPVRYFLWAVIAVSLFAGWVWRAEFWAWFSMLLVAGTAGLVWLTMTTLTVEDQSDTLLVQFGPVPLFSTKIRYEEIRDVKADRSRVIDGWGLHYVPRRGWTWNLWGFDCVEIRREKNTIRVGTDDPENLTAFLQSRLSPRKAA